jgi:hypothetical protein
LPLLLNNQPLISPSLVFYGLWGKESNAYASILSTSNTGVKLDYIAMYSPIFRIIEKITSKLQTTVSLLIKTNFTPNFTLSERKQFIKIIGKLSNLFALVDKDEIIRLIDVISVTFASDIPGKSLKSLLTEMWDYFNSDKPEILIDLLNITPQTRTIEVYFEAFASFIGILNRSKLLGINYKITNAAISDYIKNIIRSYKETINKARYNTEVGMSIGELRVLYSRMMSLATLDKAEATTKINSYLESVTKLASKLNDPNVGFEEKLKLQGNMDGLNKELNNSVINMMNLTNTVAELTKIQIPETLPASEIQKKFIQLTTIYPKGSVFS